MLDFLQSVSKEVYVFLVSMLPILELRAAIPIGAATGMSIYECYFISVIGNILPIPFILIFIKKIIEYIQEKGEKMHIASPPVLYFSQLFRYCSYNRKQSVSSLVF